MALAEAYPQLSFTVQDLAEVIPPRANKGGICARLQFQAQNFFNPQPVSGADVYLLRMILHNWGADDAVRILSGIIPAMSEQSRIIVMDTVLPAPGSVPASRERILRLRDMAMMQVFNSHERTLEDWKLLFEKADKRLKLRGVNQPVGSVMSLMELTLDKE